MQQDQTSTADVGITSTQNIINKPYKLETIQMIKLTFNELPVCSNLRIIRPADNRQEFSRLCDYMLTYSKYPV